MKIRLLKTAFALFLGISAAWPLGATPTESIGMQVLPAPGPVAVDGKFDDWDLSGSIFASGNVETQRDNYSVWISTMYDDRNFYVLARFNDKSPLNNPGRTVGSFGFDGDSLQVRFITNPGAPDEMVSFVTAWKGSDGKDVVGIEYPDLKATASIADAKDQGAQQAFQVNADGSGYVQEIAIPWFLLTKSGDPLHAGDQLQITFEPNFTVGSSGRWSVKDVFQPGMPLDRVFTFTDRKEWGTATLLSKGHVPIHPVRLAGGRTFPVQMRKGVPFVDWTGLIQERKTVGFKPISFTTPSDGYVSLNILDGQGRTVRQLINGEFFASGAHTVLWDGLTTPNYDKMGDAVAAGAYSWRAIFNKGLGLRLRGWADNAGSVPWGNGPTTNWGGDHGTPCDCASEAGLVYLGWDYAEAGKALVATDLDGNVVWRNPTGDMTGARLLAASDGVVYAACENKEVYRLDAKTGSFLSWSGSGAPAINPLELWPDPASTPDALDGLGAGHGKIYLSFAQKNVVVVADGASGAYIKQFAVRSPGMIKVGADGQIYVVCGGASVVKLDPANGAVTPLVVGLTNAVGIALDAGGNIYVDVRDPDNQIRVYDFAGKFTRTIGRGGGRVSGAPWNPDGIRFGDGMTVDGAGKLWVAEKDDLPKRISVWDTQTGLFLKEYFGPTHYGAVGGSIDPRDPNVMVGSGCEWRLDPATGRAHVTYSFPRTAEAHSENGIGDSGWGIGSNGRLYVAISPAWSNNKDSTTYIYERMGDADYKLRTTISVDSAADTTTVFSDENDNGIADPGETSTTSPALHFTGWYLDMSPSLAFYAGGLIAPVVGFTDCGAPKYDFANATRIAGVDANLRGIPSPDGKQLLVENGWDGDVYGTFDCYDVATGQKVWTYPDSFVNVHGSHSAPPSEAGKIYGSYGSVGSANLPAPIGNVWVIPTNIGEWHILTQDGFYLSRLFQPDPLQVKWPDQATPGADMTNAPPGGGGEDFGGSICQGVDGKFYVGAGNTAYWNLELTGLDTVKPLQGGALSMSAADVASAQRYREKEMQAAQGERSLTVFKRTPTLTGDLTGDFEGETIVNYQKGADTATRSAAAWDDANLYVGWDVTDNTPWVNGSGDAAHMYVGGDTVDLQLGTDPSADPNRTQAVAGDLRISIGAVHGENIAEIYRKVSDVKQPMTFHSGVIKNYQMDYVAQIPAQIVVVKRSDGYSVEAAIPLAALDLRSLDGLKLRGDLGVTFGDTGGQRTRLRSYWSNQRTGIVDDAVFELQMEPDNWGEITFSR